MTRHHVGTGWVGTADDFGDGLSGLDIMLATLLQRVTPVEDSYITSGPATRRAWVDDALAVRHRDLVKWRDGVYERHRRP